MRHGHAEPTDGHEPRARSHLEARSDATSGIRPARTVRTMPALLKTCAASIRLRLAKFIAEFLLTAAFARSVACSGRPWGRCGSHDSLEMLQRAGGR